MNVPSTDHPGGHVLTDLAVMASHFPTIGDLLKALAHFKDVQFDRDVLDMPCTSLCGKDCARALVAGNALADICADVRDRLVDTVCGQVNVFVYG